MTASPHAPRWRRRRRRRCAEPLAIQRERRVERLFFALGCAFAFFGVALGAFAAHALKGRVEPDLLAIFETGVRYQLVHALALLAVGWACTRWPGRPVIASGWLFVAGTILFSGSLYLLSLSGMRWLGAITPIGGLVWLAGWMCLAWAACRSKPM